jgi:hypothetical protein
MMPLVRITCLLVSLIVLGPVLPAAASVELVRDDRSDSVVDLECLGLISGQCPDPSETPGAPPAPFADWTADFHQSSVGTTSMSAHARGQGSLTDYGVTEPGQPYDYYGHGESFRFDVTFDVLAPVEFDITGFIFSDVGAGGQTTLTLFQDGIVLFRPVWDESFLFQTLLDVGRYQLVATADAPMSAWGSAGVLDFTATMTPVPEPGTALLLAVGLMLLAGSRR